jgi:hypothetical protein
LLTLAGSQTLKATVGNRRNEEMSMIQYFLAVDAADGQRILGTPSEMVPFLQAVDAAYKSWGDRFVNIDKAWNGIHFLLTANPEECDHPLNAVIFGGQECGDDVGYGPARIQKPEEVRVVYELIKGISESDLASRYNLKEFRTKHIYPTGWSSDKDNEYLTSYFAEIQKFYAMAVTGDYWVIKFLS